MKQYGPSKYTMDQENPELYVVPVEDICDVLSPPAVDRHGIYTFPQCPSPNQPNPPVQLSLPLTPIKQANIPHTPTKIRSLPLTPPKNSSQTSNPLVGDFVSVAVYSAKGKKENFVAVVSPIFNTSTHL